MRQWLIIFSVMLSLLGTSCRSGGKSNSDSTGGTGEVQLQSARDGAFTGFLWKPESERNGNLVVLLPNSLRGLVGAGDVAIHSGLPPSSGNKLEDGAFDGDAANGARPDYRFTQSGAAFGSNIYVVANVAATATTAASRMAWFIENGADRVD